MTSFGAGRVGEADEERDDGLDTIVAKTRRTLNGESRDRGNTGGGQRTSHESALPFRISFLRSVYERPDG